MLEEFYGVRYPEGPFKQLYGWNSMIVDVWLPSIAELIGYNPGTQNAANGGYDSAMQGLACTNNSWVDAKGGTQWAYFVQYNVSGGGTAIWNACNHEPAWTRSPDIGLPNSPWSVKDATTLIGAPVTCTASAAVHPAAGDTPRMAFAGIKNCKAKTVDQTNLVLPHRLFLIRIPCKLFVQEVIIVFPVFPDCITPRGGRRGSRWQPRYPKWLH